MTKPATADVAAARALCRTARKAVLATLDSTTGAPFASLVLTATDVAGNPLLLLSDLAVHTRNIKCDGRASLLIDGTVAAGDPMAGGRITLTGEIKPVGDAARSLLQRFLARHPSANMFASLADFNLYCLEIASAHLIQGFGRIRSMLGADLLIPPADADAFLQGEQLVLDAANRWIAAAAIADRPTAIGADPEGIDLAAGSATTRELYANIAETPAQAIEMLPAALAGLTCKSTS